MAIKSFTLRGQDFQCFDAGSGDRVLLFVHGFPLDHHQWQPQLDHFVHSYRVIAPDLRGLGHSFITGDDVTVTMEQHADDLVAILDHLQVVSPVIYIGLSMGGYVAWQMVRKYPQRLAALVQAHTRIATDTPAQAVARHNLAAQTLSEQSSRAVLETMLPRLVPSSAPTAVVDAIMTMAQTASPAGLAANLRGLALRPDATTILPTIRLPVLAISGDLDAISPPQEMQDWADQIPDSRFISLPNVGHLSPLEDFQAFNQCLAEFLRDSLGR